MKGFNCCTYVIIYFNTIIQEIEDLSSIKILLLSVLNAMRMKTCATYAFFIEIYHFYIPGHFYIYFFIYLFIFGEGRGEKEKLKSKHENHQKIDMPKTG